jgi:Spy/CpxP family protein refolding chaperone
MKQLCNTTLAAFLVVLFTLLSTAPAMAQEKAAKSKKPRTEKTEKAAKPAQNKDAIWTLQAQGFADELGLTKEKRLKLIQVYEAARLSQKEAVKKLPEETDRQKSRAATQEVNVKERAKLEAALKGIVNPQQAAKILPVLGSFNNRYDSYVAALAEFKLDNQKMSKGLKVIAEYTTAYEKARAEAAASGGNFSANTSRELKEKLDAGIAPLLSAEQVAKWNEATARGKSDAKAKSK